MTKSEGGSLDSYRDLCHMHWSNDDVICILSGQGQVKMPGFKYTLWPNLTKIVTLNANANENISLNILCGLI